MTGLARRAVACPGWRWLPGMLTEGWRLTCVSLHDGAWSATSTLTPTQYHYPTLPNLEDPATLGCLLALVRAAWGDEHLHVGRRIAGWGVWTSESTPLPQCVGKADTEAEALVLALEAAP